MSAHRLTPSLRERVWGRTRLAPWFPDSDRPIGEAWYLSDRDLPLLDKLLFTSAKLSLQVHPDDGEGCVRGKTEMWHILDADPGATIALGFRERITRDRLVETCRSFNGRVERLHVIQPFEIEITDDFDFTMGEAAEVAHEVRTPIPTADNGKTN